VTARPWETKRWPVRLKARREIWPTGERVEEPFEARDQPFALCGVRATSIASWMCAAS
jgi:hypothetical protein